MLILLSGESFKGLPSATALVAPEVQRKQTAAVRHLRCFWVRIQYRRYHLHRRLRRDRHFTGSWQWART